MKKEKNLFNVQFGLSEKNLNKQKKVKSAVKISKLLRKKNILSVGEPEVFNLVKLYKEKNVDIPIEVKLMLKEYDFYQVRFACTFKPDKDCKFTWARFGITLIGKNGEDVLEPKLPVAYDLYPKEIYKEIKVKRNYSIGPKINFNFFEIGVTFVNEKDYIRYEPEIVCYGVLQSDPGWDFSRSRAKDFIAGDKELFMILKTPKDLKVGANFVLAAEVHIFKEIFPMIPVRIRIRKKDSIVEGKFLLIR